MANILYRGQYDQPREQVEPNVPAALPPLPASYPRNRLGLARWLVEPSNPLMARVTVNRFWQEIFGTGIVKTSEDFRFARTASHTSGITRLVGGGISRIGVGRKAAVQAHGHFCCLPTVSFGQRGKAAESIQTIA